MIKWFLSLPWYAQLGIVVVLAIIAYQIFLYFKRKAESGNYNAAVNQSQTALIQLEQQGIKPSYGQAQYTAWANTLAIQFEGCNAAGSAAAFWDALTPIFQSMKNDADVYALIKAYNVRTFDKCGLFTGDFTGDLSASLSEKFSGLEGSLIRKSIGDINDILQKNGVGFKF